MRFWPKRAPHDLKRAFCTYFIESALFFCFEENFRLVWRSWELCTQKWDLAKTSYAWSEKSVLYNFHEKRTVFPFCRGFETSVTILRSLTLKNAILLKRAAHDLKSGFCTIFMKSALFSLFGENLRQVSRSWQLWRSEMRKGQNVPRMTWKGGFAQFSWKAPFLPFWREFDNFDAHKCDRAKACRAWPEKRVLYNFYGKRTVFPFWWGC